jgi:hypothetical protein
LTGPRPSSSSRTISRKRRFHGNSNWNEFYGWNGPSHSVTLHTFRVDSPMKGAVSADDESRLSFHVASIDTTTQMMTVRECLWNVNPAASSQPCTWGESVTVALARASQRSTR